MGRGEVSRGELWWVDWSPGRGSEQAGLRPALVVQTDAGNDNPSYPNTIVVAVSTKGRELPFHVKLEPSPGNGLRARSYVKCEQVFTISKERLQGRMGKVTADELAKVEDGLRMVLGP
jgi:mRNA interferase MazF